MSCHVVMFASSYHNRLAATSARERGYTRERILGDLENTIWVRHHTLRYLAHHPAGTQTSEHTHAFMSALQTLLKQHGVRLTTAEILQLINLRPTTMVEIHRVSEGG